ncbi:MAG: dihydroorotase [Oscillospiraceae bacterium]|nr:dihydroorotase [Oscillospiraceae bacterium]
MGDILIKNINLVNDDNLSLYIKNGVIAQIEAELDFPAERVIDGKGRLTAIPTLFDMHVHLRDPGQTHKEDILSGCAAALAGGVTGLVCMPNTTPPTDSLEAVRYITDRAKGTGVEVYPASCITRGMKGEKLCDFGALGVRLATDDGKPVEDAELMKAALATADRCGVVIASHCESLIIAGKGIVNKGDVSQKLGVEGIDRAAEDIMTARDIKLAEETGAAVHICHVSTKGSFDLIRKAKARGVKVTCETCPHYFDLNEEKLLLRDADYRMNPPLRTESDRKAAFKAVIDGTVDCIVTDHAPHTAAEKADFLSAPNGVVGLETSLAVTLTAFYHTAKLGLRRLTELMSLNPRKILGLPAYEIKEGSPANIALVDLQHEWVVKPEMLLSKSKNTAFKGMTLKGKNVMTIVDGVIVYEIK